jgi:hypothetical protein
LHRALGDVAHLFRQLLVNVVEQLVQGDEVLSLDVPVGLPRLRLEVDGVGWPRVEQFERLAADFLRQVDLGLKRGDWLLTAGDGSSNDPPILPSVAGGQRAG